MRQNGKNPMRSYAGADESFCDAAEESGLYRNYQSNENIDQMLMERHLNKKARRASGKNHLKGPRKRTAEDDEHFRESFEKMIHMAMDKEN